MRKEKFHILLSLSLYQRALQRSKICNKRRIRTVLCCPLMMCASFKSVDIHYRSRNERSCFSTYIISLPTIIYGSNCWILHAWLVPVLKFRSLLFRFLLPSARIKLISQSHLAIPRAALFRPSDWIWFSLKVSSTIWVNSFRFTSKQFAVSRWLAWQTTSPKTDRYFSKKIWKMNPDGNSSCEG